jgi:hypothetical protein
MIFPGPESSLFRPGSDQRSTIAPFLGLGFLPPPPDPQPGVAKITFTSPLSMITEKPQSSDTLRGQGH